MHTLNACVYILVNVHLAEYDIVSIFKCISQTITSTSVMGSEPYNASLGSLIFQGTG